MLLGFFIVCLGHVGIFWACGLHSANVILSLFIYSIEKIKVWKLKLTETKKASCVGSAIFNSLSQYGVHLDVDTATAQWQVLSAFLLEREQVISHD